MQHEPAKLFRPEAQTANSLAWLGTPLLPHSLPSWVTTGITTGLIVLLIAFASLGSYTRRVAVEGILLPTSGVSRVHTPATGWISRQWVKEGEVVQAGQPLYNVRLDTIISEGSAQEAIVGLLKEKRAALRADIARQKEIAAEKKRSLVAQKNSVAAEVAQIGQQVTLAASQLETLREMLVRQQQNLKKGLVTTRDYEVRLQSFMTQQSQLEQLKREKLTSESRLTEIDGLLKGHELNAAADLSNLDQQLIDIEQRLAEGESKREMTITAPRSGKVTAIVGQAGQTVMSGAPLLSIVPEGEQLEAHLIVPGNAIGFVREGQTVLLRYDAFPYQKFGQFPAKIKDISRTTLSIEEMQATGLPTGSDPTPMYRLIVQPADNSVDIGGTRAALQAGMRLSGSVLGETRPIYRWILDPVMAFARSANINDGVTQR